MLNESKEEMKRIQDFTINNPSDITKIRKERIYKLRNSKLSTEVYQLIFKRAIKHIKNSIETFEKQLNENRVMI